ncbi:MAG: hypothetical protein JNK78_06785 [Planctomycetes bacterium]|nr:hypothetical protein [Planctomycetota bacterium]
MNDTAIERAGPSAALGEAPHSLARLRSRARSGIFIEALGMLGLLGIAFAVPSFLTDRSLRLEWPFRLVLLVTFVVVVVRVLQRRLLSPLGVHLTDDEMALAVERRSPDVKQALISSLQFDRDLATGRPSPDSAELKAAVVAQLRERAAAIPFGRAIDAGRVQRFALALATVVACFGAWGALSPSTLSLWARRNLLLSNVDWPRYTSLAFADVADATIRLPQGDPVTVRVTATGPVPDQVFVDYVFRGGERGTEPMSRTGEREFAWTLDTVLGDLSLRVQGGDSLPIELALAVVERPRIEGLTIRVTYPDYMERDAETVPATEGEVRLPRGARLTIDGRSHKVIDEAFLLFGTDEKTRLERAGDGHAFHGEFAPSGSGLLVVDVIDRDRLGSGAPPKVLLRVGDDKSPTVDFRLRGISSSITAHARIPGDLKVKDDFGLREILAWTRTTIEATADGNPDAGAPKPAEEPFAKAVATFGAALERSALRYETTATVDLTQWNHVPDENAKDNPIRPGMLFSLRFGAKDNFGPGDPHEGAGETMTFRVVTREKLVEELRRRQIEQREELKRLADEIQTTQLELRDTANPAQAGDRRKAAEARFKTLARQLVSFGRRTAFVGEAYQRILWEYENNRIFDANKTRERESRITAPLARLGKEAFPAASRSADAFAGSCDEATRGVAVDGCTEILRTIAAVLKEMEETETLAALLEDLRVVIKIEDEAIRDVEKRVKERETDVFGDPKDEKK